MLHALEAIEDSAFAFCNALSVVKWSPNLKNIGEWAFCNCTCLEEADMSNLVALETIGERSFAWCRALAVVKWAPNLKAIGYDAFWFRTLHSIMIPLRHRWFI